MKISARKLLVGTILALAAPFAMPTTMRAADHGDGPTASNDQACDIADVFFFLDPNDNSQAIIIATFRGFIVPSEAVNFGIFDPNVRYRFQIENTGNAKPDKFIDVSFSRRTSTSAAQTATIKISGIPGKFTANATNPSLALAGAGQTNDTAPTQVVSTLVSTLGTTGIKFFAGEVDDPFFFDIPAFSRFVASFTPGPPDPTILNRGRDSFAGYNVMSIALSVPVALLKASGASAPTTLGLNFLTQRHVIETPNVRGETHGSGDFRNIDRMGIPAVNVALIPFALKNRYNAGSTVDDKNLVFAQPILDTLKLLGTSGANVFPPTGNALILAQVAVLNGDMLRLDTTRANTGLGGGDNLGVDAAHPAGFPNGRRLRDDTIDIILGIIAGGTLGDNVNASDVAPRNTFPFLAPSQQPRVNGTVEDTTRN